MLLKALPRTVLLGTTLLARLIPSSSSEGSIMTGASQDVDEFIHVEERLEAMPNLPTSVLDQRLLIPSIEGAAGVDAATDVRDLQTELTAGVQVEKKKFRLAIAVISARPERRKAIRETWLNWSDDRVVLRFFTEPPAEKAEADAAILTEEMKIYGDVVIQNIERGMNFGLKILESMRWMSDRYSFDYYLRLDDDYFLCLRRLVDELDCLHAPHNRPPAPFYSGYRACRKDMAASYVDESYLLVSSVIVQRIISASDLQCSSYGSLTVGAWVTIGNAGNPKGDVEHVLDDRLDRWGSWWKTIEENSTTFRDVCELKMGVHRTYPVQMYLMWNASRLTSGSRTYVAGCESFSYVDDGQCPYVMRGVPAEAIQKDKGQPCDSYTVGKSTMYCGHHGCRGN